MNEKSLPLNDIQNKQIIAFAGLIHEYNGKFNLTGLSSPDEIRQKLILESIAPARDLEINPGSRFVDIGSGSGIPGIPIGIYYSNITGLLIEANEKKERFINQAINNLGLKNLVSLCGRAEELGQDPVFREKADWVFARAVGSPYLTMELGAPFVACGGHLYIYSALTWENLNDNIKSHANALGMAPAHQRLKGVVESPGILLKKISTTDGKYPRRFSALSREARKHEKL